MTRIDPDSIGPLLDALVGDTGAHGDSTMDDNSLKNLVYLEAVCDWLEGRIYPACNGLYPSQCYSAGQVAAKIRKMAYGILYTLDIDEDDVLNVAAEIADASDKAGDIVTLSTELLREWSSRIRSAMKFTR